MTSWPANESRGRAATRVSRTDSRGDSLKIQATESDGAEYDIKEPVFDLLREHSRLLYFAGIPIQAWMPGVLFRRRRLNFAEHCTFFLFCAGQATLLLRLPAAITAHYTGRWLPTGGVLVLPYSIWGARGFYGTTWARATLALLSSGLAAVLALLLIYSACVAAALAFSS